MLTDTVRKKRNFTVRNLVLQIGFQKHSSLICPVCFVRLSPRATLVTWTLSNLPPMLSLYRPLRSVRPCCTEIIDHFVLDEILISLHLDVVSGSYHLKGTVSRDCCAVNVVQYGWLAQNAKDPGGFQTNELFLGYLIFMSRWPTYCTY